MAVSRAEMEKTVRDWYRMNGFEENRTLRGILRHGLERIYDQIMLAGRVTLRPHAFEQAARFTPYRSLRDRA